jgi:hypothetical protein
MVVMHDDQNNRKIRNATNRGDRKFSISRENQCRKVKINAAKNLKLIETEIFNALIYF